MPEILDDSGQPARLSGRASGIDFTPMPLARKLPILAVFSRDARGTFCGVERSLSGPGMAVACSIVARLRAGGLARGVLLVQPDGSVTISATEADIADEPNRLVTHASGTANIAGLWVHAAELQGA